MGANEKHAATYHGAEYTPSTKVVRAIFSHHRDAGMEAYNVGIFDRWLETVRAEAKAEALEAAANEVGAWGTECIPAARALSVRANQLRETQ